MLVRGFLVRHKIAPANWDRIYDSVHLVIDKARGGMVFFRRFPAHIIRFKTAGQVMETLEANRTLGGNS